MMMWDYMEMDREELTQVPMIKNPLPVPGPGSPENLILIRPMYQNQTRWD